MTDKQVGIKINVGVQGQKDLQGLATQLDELGADAAQAGTGAAQAGKAVDQLGTAARSAGAAATTGSQGARQMAEAARQAGAETAAAARGIAGMGTAAEQAEDRLGATRRGLQSISSQLADTQRQLGNLRDSLIAGFSFQQFVQAAAQMESVQAGLQAVTGNSKLAGEQMDFVRRMATAAGVDVTAAGQAFLGLAAATKGTAVEGEPARQVFEAVTLAMAKAGKSSADTQNALLALSQIASKGTVSMEELRGQLGEALPGALQAAANGLGITTQDLIKLVENGQVAAEDLFPALAKGLGELYGGAPAAQTLSQEITNIKNAFVEMAADLGEAGGLDALKIGAEAGQLAITLLGDTIITTGQYIGALAGAVATLDFSGLSDAFKQIEADSRDRLLKAAAHNDTLRAALKLSSSEATQAALATQEAAKGHAAAGAAAGQAAAGFTQLSVAFAKARTEAEAQITLADKEVQAVKARGEASVAHAKALGDEGLQRKAVAQAAADEAKAMRNAANAREGELNLLKIELAERTKALDQGGQASEQRKKEIEELTALIAQKQIDVDKSKAQAAAATEAAKAKSEAVTAARAEREAVESLNSVRKTEAQAVVTGLQAQKELARQAGEMARLLGDEEAAREANILQLEIEIKLVKARAEVAKVEAEGSIAVAQAKLAELRASGQLTPLKEAEINASIKLAQAKLAEAQAMGSSTAVLERQIEALRNGTAGTNNLAGAQSGLASRTRQANAAVADQLVQLGGLDDKVRKVTTSVIGLGQAWSAEQKARNSSVKSMYEAGEGRYDKEGFALNMNGQRVIAGGQLKVPEMPGDWEFVSDAAYPESKAVDPSLVVNGVGYWRDRTPNAGALKARSAGPSAAAPAPVPAPVAAPARATSDAAASRPTVHTINLSIGGLMQGSFNVATADDAARVDSFFRELERAASMAARSR